MRIVYIYRAIGLGFSIDSVFRPIQNAMKDHCEVNEVNFDKPDYKIQTIIKNIQKVRHYMKDNPNDIIHITGAEHYLLPFLKKYKTVVTVHDLGFFTTQKKTIKVLLKYPLWIYSLKYADKVTFISDKSKQEAMNLVHLDSKKVAVIMNPVSDGFKPRENHEYNGNKPVVLFVGTGVNKNLPRTVEALKGIECSLRIIGELSQEYRNMLDESGIEYSQTQGLSNEQMIQEYQNCDIVSFASMTEGFGMPIIEGQAVGKVILTSNISPMKEVADGSCVLVDPFDVDSIHNGFIEAINNHEKYEMLGKKNVKRFSLKNVVNEYYELYKTL